METTLARRIRRIGLLPQLSIEELMDDNMKTKLKNATDKAESGSAEDIALLAEITADIKRQLLPSTVRRMELTPEQRKVECDKLRSEHKAARIARLAKLKGKKA